MDVVAIVALARNAADEVPVLAAELGMTAYEAGLMLRSPPPIVVGRFDDRSKSGALAGRLRARGHDVVVCELETVIVSDAMFHPKSFRIEDGELVGIGGGEERRLPFAGLFAILRANHVTRVEETRKTSEVTLDIGRAAMTGGMMVTRTKTTESKHTSDHREPVLYLFRVDEAPWLICSTEVRYDGLGADMKRSKVENFEVLIGRLRELAPDAVYDTRLLAARPLPAPARVGANHLRSSTTGAIDLSAHILATSLAKGARPYR